MPPLPQITLAAAVDCVRPVTRLLEARDLTVATVVGGHYPPPATEGPAGQTDADLPDVTEPEPFPQHHGGLLFAVCYPWRIPAQVLCEYDVRLGFHPAPLPDLRGLHPFEVAIVEDRPDYAVTCHHLSDELNRGDVVAGIAVERREDDTAIALARRSLMSILVLIDQVVTLLEKSWPSPPLGTTQGKGRFASREYARQVCWPTTDDDDKMLDRKMRAVCWDNRTARFGDRSFPLGDDGREALRAWLSRPNGKRTSALLTL